MIKTVDSLLPPSTPNRRDLSTDMRHNMIVQRLPTFSNLINNTPFRCSLASSDTPITSYKTSLASLCVQTNVSLLPKIDDDFSSLACKDELTSSCNESNEDQICSVDRNSFSSDVNSPRSILKSLRNSRFGSKTERLVIRMGSASPARVRIVIPREKSNCNNRCSSPSRFKVYKKLKTRCR